jgi:hypothetical protein
MNIRAGTKIIDNVSVELVDELTGEVRSFSSHNTPLSFAFSALSQWIGGKNNSGYQALLPPSQTQLGKGTGTPSVDDPGLFTPIPGVFEASYVQQNTPSGTTTFVFQIPAGAVTEQITEALIRDSSVNPWFHTMFPEPFTPSLTENITLQWEVTFSA